MLKDYDDILEFKRKLNKETLSEKLKTEGKQCIIFGLSVNMK